jgi:hypothetical protein
VREVNRLTLTDGEIKMTENDISILAEKTLNEYCEKYIQENGKYPNESEVYHFRLGFKSGYVEAYNLMSQRLSEATTALAEKETTIENFRNLVAMKEKALEVAKERVIK